MRTNVLLLLVATSFVAGCQTAQQKMVWHHPTHGYSWDAPDRFEAAKGRSTAVFNRVFNSGPDVPALQSLPQKPPSYNLSGTSTYSDNLGTLGYGSFQGTARPKANTNLVTAFEEGRQVARVSAYNDMVINQLYAKQAAADRAFDAEMARQGWTLTPRPQKPNR
jgi:hypothetical protein